MNLRVWSIARKEVIQLRRDRRVLPLILILPIIQVLLFGYVAATDVKNIKFGLLDLDQTRISRELVARIEQSGFFHNQGTVADYRQLERMLAAGQIRIGLVVPAEFSRDLQKQAQPTLQVLIDGSDSNTAVIAQNYFVSIINHFQQQLARERLVRSGLRPDALEPLVLKQRVYYNPELRGANYMVPAITALVLLLTTAMLTALAIVKEKELGTIEQIMVTPVKPWEFILGKLLPFPVIGLIDVILVIGVGSLWFAVPIKGSIPLLLGSAFLFLLTTLGIGLLISTISQTQQQALLTTIFFLIPNILLSGFVFPIANMPRLLQGLTYLVPARYFIEIIRSIYLKGLGAAHLYPQLLALGLMGLIILGYAARGFHKKLA